MNIIAFIFYILMVVGLWKMFEKAGVSGWKAVIPFYNVYCMVEMVGRKPSYFWYMNLPIILLFLSVSIWGIVSLLGAIFPLGITNQALIQVVVPLTYIANNILPLVDMVLVGCFFLVSFPMLIILYNDISKSFGKGKWMTVGLIFIPYVCNLVLGFGDAQFRKIERDLQLSSVPQQ
jgi:hypothetical protein